MAKYPRLLNPDEYRSLSAEEKLKYLRAMMDTLRATSLDEVERRAPRRDSGSPGDKTAGSRRRR